MGDESSAAILRDIRNVLRELHTRAVQISLRAIGAPDLKLANKMDELQRFDAPALGRAIDGAALKQILTELKKLQELLILTMTYLPISPQKKPE
jgi:hypothetical protein